MTELVELGKNIVSLRVAQKLTQEAVAHQSNLSVTRLQTLEYGCQNTTVDTLIRVARTFGIDSRVFCIFSKPDAAILSEYRRAPRLPERNGGVLQICENIVLLRKVRGFSQRQLANRAGISDVCLRDIEHACANVTIHKLACVAKAFDLSLMELDVCTISEAELMEMIYGARRQAGLGGNLSEKYTF